MNKLIPFNILTYFTLLDGERFFYHVDGSSTRGGLYGVRPSADRSAARTSLVAGGGYGAGSQRAYSLGGCAMGQTDG